MRSRWVEYLPVILFIANAIGALALNVGILDNRNIIYGDVRAAYYSIFGVFWITIGGLV